MYSAEPVLVANVRSESQTQAVRARANVRVSATLALLTIYAFLAPLGNLTRFGSSETEFGLTSVVLALALAVNLIPILIITVKNRVLLALLVLACWVAISGLLSDNLREAYSQLAGFIVYVFFAGLGLSIDWSLVRVRRLLLSLVIGGLISSSLTLVDWYGLVDVPGVNELSISTRTELGYVMQASGPFGRRSAMAAYFALLIPLGVLGALYAKEVSRAVRIIFATTAVTCAIALILSHNRAGLLGGLAAIASVTLYLARSPARLVRVLLFGAAGLVAFGWLVALYLPDQFNTYRALLNVGGVASADAFLAESDKLRLVFLERAITGLASNPVGHGYTMLTGIPGFNRIDPHNILAQIVWAAGVFGLCWIFVFSGMVFRQLRVLFTKRHIREPIAQYGVAIAGGLWGWFLCGMAHTIIATGVSWLLFGVALRIANDVRRHRRFELSASR